MIVVHSDGTVNQFYVAAVNFVNFVYNCHMDVMGKSGFLRFSIIYR